MVQKNESRPGRLACCIAGKKGQGRGRGRVLASGKTKKGCEGSEPVVGLVLGSRPCFFEFIGDNGRTGGDVFNRTFCWRGALSISDRVCIIVLPLPRRPARPPRPRTSKPRPRPRPIPPSHGAPAQPPVFPPPPIELSIADARISKIQAGSV